MNFSLLHLCIHTYGQNPACVQSHSANPTSSRLERECKVESTQHTSNADNITRLSHLRVRDRLAKIPGQMSQAVQAVEGKWQCQRRLQSQLRSQWPSSDASGHDGALKVDAQSGGDQITHAVEVEDAGEHDTRDAIQRRRDPGHLPLVDGEMWGDWSLQALLCEDLCAGVRCHILRCRLSVPYLASRDPCRAHDSASNYPPTSSASIAHL